MPLEKSLRSWRKRCTLGVYYSPCTVIDACIHTLLILIMKHYDIYARDYKIEDKGAEYIAHGHRRDGWFYLYLNTSLYFKEDTQGRIFLYKHII